MSLDMPEICELCGENINGYGHGVDCPERTAAVYLIERSQPEGQFPTMWWTHDLEWTEDANKATRFDTRTAAEAMLEQHSGIKGVHRAFGHVTPHLWLTRERTEEPRGGASSSGSAPECHDPSHMQSPPTDADEPPWPGWFSCPDCWGWFYGEPNAFDSGDEVCGACADKRDAKNAAAASGSAPPNPGDHP